VEKRAMRHFYVPLVALFSNYGCEPKVAFTGRSLDKGPMVVLEDKEFAAALISEAETKYQPDFGLIADQMTLKQKPLLKSALKQIVREPVSEVFFQGHDGDQIYQEFDISATGKLDLMIVIDNSGSMGEEQAELSENLKALTLHMDNVDWQIGVLTTDLCNLQNAKNPDQPIKKGDPDAFTNFEQTVKGLGTGGNRDERGIKMAMLHLMGKCPTGKNSWLRPDAVLGVFFVSDEQNECDLDCKDEKGVAWGPDELIALMKSLRKASDLKAYAILWNRDVAGVGSYNPMCRRDSGVEAYGTRYSQVVQAFNGIERSICLDNSPLTNDYIPLLELVSKDVSRVVRNEFVVKSDPIPGTMSVTVDGAPAPDAVISGRKIVLKNARGDQGKLQVSYRTGAVNRFDRLSIAQLAAKETLKVTVNGVVDDQCSFDGKNILFTVRPPDRAEVKIAYRKNISLLTDFYVGAIPVENQVKGVWVQGLENTEWTYSPEKKVISFPKPPLDGETIEFEYLEKNPKIVSYKLPDNRTEPRRLHVFDLESGEDLRAKIEKGSILFDETQVEDGKKVVIEYNYGDATDVLSEELPYEPLEGYVDISSNGGNDSCIEEVTLIGRKLSFICNGSQLGEVTVRYKYLIEKYTQFRLANPIPKEATIMVYVDGLAIKEFTWQDTTVSVPEKYLSLDSKIRILVGLEDTSI
jgi:hypothetical protein